MVSDSVLRQRNENAKRLKHSSRMSNNRNHIRLHPQNSLKHEMKKVEICWNLLQDGVEFITEAEFEEKDIRADIFVLDDGRIYEIESSDYELDERKSKYPDEDLNIVLLDEDDVGIGEMLENE